MLDVKEFVMW